MGGNALVGRWVRWATERCESEANEAEQHSDHKGVAAVLMGVEDNQAARVCRQARDEKDMQDSEQNPRSPALATSNGDQREAQPQQSERGSQSDGPECRILGDKCGVELRVSVRISRRRKGCVE